MTRGRAGSAMALMMVSATGIGCFDVRSIDAGPPVLDDFEDGNLTPSLSPFNNWSCQQFSPEVDLDCAITPGFDSAFSLSASFTIIDPPDAIQQHGGIMMMTFADSPIDLTGFSAITFAVRLTSATTPFPSNALMHLDLQCSTAISDTGAQLTDFSVVQGLPFSADWSTVSLAISNFGPAPWRTDHIQGGAPACLRAVDGFLFVFDAAIPDGQMGGGVFSIDNVRLQ